MLFSPGWAVGCVSVRLRANERLSLLYTVDAGLHFSSQPGFRGRLRCPMQFFEKPLSTVPTLGLNRLWISPIKKRRLGTRF